MTQTCPNCGTSNRPGARFCNSCATSLHSGAVTPGSGTGMLPSQSMLAGRYIILRKVGQGGFGAVYQAADARISGKMWAVKEMSDAAITNPLDRPQAIKAFNQEADLLSKLSHPNIPKVTDKFSQGGKHYLVMEFVEGETLEAKLDRQAGALSEAQVRVWAEQLCEVLDYLHNQHPPIVFRDLKPANIMIDRAGDVKLVDFGIVRFFRPGKAKDTVAFGTLGYAPPEQCGRGQTDARSDVYALGATLHHLLTGRDPTATPFRFEPVRRLNPTVSLQMEQVVMRALDQDRDRRWQRAGDMRQALRPPTHPPAPSPPRPAYPKPLAPTVVQPAVGAGISAASSFPPAPAVAQASAVRPRPATSPWPMGMDYAGFGQRVLAYIIDGLLVSMSYGIVSAIPSLLYSLDPGLDEVAAVFLCLGQLILFPLFFWYYVFFPARSGQTLGKRIMGIKIVSADGDSPGVGRCLVRLIGYWISGLILYIGFLMPLWDEENRALHDMIAGTRVIRA